MASAADVLANADRSLDTAAALSGRPELQALVAERNALEARMASLVSGTAPGSSSDPRFPVQTFAERQSEFREWESRHAELARAASNPIEALRARRGPAQETEGGVAGGLSVNRLVDAGTGLLRDRVDAALPSIDPVMEKPRKAARNVLDRIEKAESEAGQQLDGFRRSSMEKQVDDKLRAEGVSDADREEVRSSLREELPDTDKVLGPLSKATERVKTPLRKVATGKWLW